MGGRRSRGSPNARPLPRLSLGLPRVFRPKHPERALLGAGGPERDAAANGAREEVIEFAEAGSRNQRIEVIEYEGAVRRLGLP